MLEGTLTLGGAEGNAVTLRQEFTSFTAPAEKAEMRRVQSSQNLGSTSSLVS